MKFHVITRCTRVKNLLTIADSVYKHGVDVTWHVVFDTSVVKEIEASLLGELYKLGAILYFKQGSPGTYMYPEMNDIVSQLNANEYVTLIDDDNIVHPNYYDVIVEEIIKNPLKDAFCYNQLVNVSNGTHRQVSPSNTVVGGIDLAQFTVSISTFIHFQFGSGYCGDGEFIQALHNSRPNTFVFIDQTLCYYNYLQQVTPKKTSAPSVLYIGKDKTELKSINHLGYEDTSLNVTYATKKDLLWENFDFSKYDSIISIDSDGWASIPLLPTESKDISKRWLHSDGVIENIGEVAYNVAMNSILNPHKPKVSYFTPAYKTPINRIQRLYDSLDMQTALDWEWVIVNDSPQDKALSEWLEFISSCDSRVKVFSFSKSSGGVIGDVKYKAASMCSGDILAELDHDDELLPMCTQYLIEASEAHPECGFFYTNCVEVDEQYNCLKYPDGFAFGYGKYRKTFDHSVKWEYEQSVCVGINPKTIRHIVGVPNHVRAWRKDVYNKIGGHNRRLSIADDYELIVRTFLNTKFCHIDACGYIQFIYNNESGQNTHNATRGDIQRRVRTIAMHYNHDIAIRFYRLGVEDWAYKANVNNPLATPSLFGDREKSVNVKFTPKY